MRSAGDGHLGIGPVASPFFSGQDRFQAKFALRLVGIDNALNNLDNLIKADFSVVECVDRLLIG
jgi:hypothetical protein